MRIAVLGAGSWGTALAQTLAREGEDRDLVLWVRSSLGSAIIAATRHNPSYLTDLALDERISVTNDIGAAVRGAEIVVLTVPTQAMRDVATRIKPHLGRDAVVVSGAKGFEERSASTMSSVLVDVLGDRVAGQITALSGPNIAVEIARGLPAASVVAGEGSAPERVRDAFTGRSFRVYSTDDRVGVEYAGALKNIVAIAAGACDGIGAGDNGKAAIITRGLAEIARLAISAGAQMMTFAGLAGLGDCIVTCASPYSRNRRLGEAIARGATLEDALTKIRMVVEGVTAARVAVRLAEERGIDMPITREVHAVLYERKPVRVALGDLMSRDPAEELHGLTVEG